MGKEANWMLDSLMEMYLEKHKPEIAAAVGNALVQFGFQGGNVLDIATTRLI